MSTCPTCGADTAHKSPRSVRQHRRTFALLKHAYHHWPNSHEFQPESLDHLRRWLQIKAGHYTARDIDVSNMSPAQAIAATVAALKVAGEHSFIRSRGTKLRVYKPNSIAFDQLPPKEASAVFDAMSELIYAEAGLTLEDTRPEAPAKISARDLLRQSSLTPI